MLVVALVLFWTRCRKRNVKILVEGNSLPIVTWRRNSQQELLQATEGFSANNLLGEGSFGSVYHGTLLDGMCWGYIPLNPIQGGDKHLAITSDKSKNWDRTHGPIK
jgi:hypothetical protein